MTLNRRFRRRRVFGSSDHDNVRARERGNRFAEASRRQKVSFSERSRRIDQNNINVTRKLQVLKSVIQNKALDSARFQFSALLESIGAGAKFPFLAQTPAEQRRLVIPSRNNVRVLARPRSLR